MASFLWMWNLHKNALALGGSGKRRLPDPPDHGKHSFCASWRPLALPGALPRRFRTWFLVGGKVTWVAKIGRSEATMGCGKKK